MMVDRLHRWVSGPEAIVHAESAHAPSMRNAAEQRHSDEYQGAQAVAHSSFLSIGLSLQAHDKPTRGRSDTGRFYLPEWVPETFGPLGCAT
jgi:hypothetical protein